MRKVAPLILVRSITTGPIRARDWFETEQALTRVKGAGNRARTDDLLITNQLLYQLSYAGIYEGK